MSMVPARLRTMPLVPEPFEEVTRVQQSATYKEPPNAKSWCEFRLMLDTTEYREQLSEEKKMELDKRANQLFTQVSSNLSTAYSEFFWELSAWRDVFGPILGDNRLRMDKRRYEYLGTDEDGDPSVGLRVPDATMGLRTYEAGDFERDALDGAPQPDARLGAPALRAMMRNRACGLVADGAWGRADLVFPFAVYEAKKLASLSGDATEQISHACQTYLAMLDDLARDPADGGRFYQAAGSARRVQMFALTSCGPCWEVFAAYLKGPVLVVESLWSGDVSRPASAYDLVCIVDQIRDWAVHRHRPWVMRLLVAWHARQQTLSSLGAAARSKVAADVEWMRVKQDSKITKAVKAAEDRKRNLRAAMRAARGGFP